MILINSGRRGGPPTWWWWRLSVVDRGNLGYSAMTRAATASSLVLKVVAPPPMNRSPRAMLMAM